MAPATPTPDTLQVLSSLPECARNCMIKAATEVGGAIGGICDPPEPKLAEAIKTCMKAACHVREALFAQNVTQSACGVTPHVDRTFLPVLGTLLCVATIAMAMRFANRFTISGRFWWDDAFLALSWFGAIGITAITFQTKDHGLGADIWSVKFDDIDHLFASLYAAQLVYIATRLLLRHSIILFYLRIFAIGNLRPAIIIGTMVLNTLISIAVGLLLACQCRPIPFFWTRWDGNQSGTCLPSDPILWSGSIIGIVLDIWVLLLPLPYVARLQLSLKKRIGISFMLMIGIGVVTFSFLKILAVRGIETSNNPPGTLARVAIWTGVEVDVGIISACLPGIRLFITHFLHRVGWASEPGSGIRSHHISLGDNTTPSDSRQRNKMTVSSFQGSRNSQSNIRITTVIHTQERGGPPSETYLPLQPMELASNQAVVRAHAWA
ncbi:hypothetical protein QBC43DRAFT_353245 [Cladorrhinum sp. PSN259]|nr:hypothetical protein QBC43DRAFT_353245 [Cladorrhinum sp. PSN259]